MLSAADPVGAGLVASLGHPGGNITGISMVGPELEAKRVELLQEIVKTDRVGILVNPATAVSGYSRTATEDALRPLGVQPIFIEVSSADELERSVDVAAEHTVQALIVHRDVLFSLNRDRVMGAALRRRLPALVEDPGMLEAGGLLAYSVDEDDQLRRFAAFVDRILRGAKPANLPVERPTKFKLGVNVRTAEALGLTVPTSMLSRADEVFR
jgi:putative ABC transport system substrate-binding protein